jgi:hypothetical protein
MRAPGKEMGRERTSVKENPRRNYKAAFGSILATRQRQLPTNNCHAVTNPRISVWSIVAIIFLYPSLCQEVRIG